MRVNLVVDRKSFHAMQRAASHLNGSVTVAETALMDEMKNVVRILLLKISSHLLIRSMIV